MSWNAIETYGALLRAVWRAWGLLPASPPGEAAAGVRAPRDGPASPIGGQVPCAPDTSAAPEDRAAYDLRRAKNEIDAVAKHAADLVEHVIALDERAQALSGALDAKLDKLKRDVLAALDHRIAEVSRAVSGGDGPGVAFVLAALGTSVSRLPAAPAAPIGNDGDTGASRPAPPGDHRG